MDIIQIIIQAGAVGIAAYAIYSLSHIIGNHISHNSDALKELSVVLGELKELIKTHIKKD